MISTRSQETGLPSGFSTLSGTHQCSFHQFLHIFQIRLVIWQVKSIKFHKLCHLPVQETNILYEFHKPPSLVDQLSCVQFRKCSRNHHQDEIYRFENLPHNVVHQCEILLTRSQHLSPAMIRQIIPVKFIYNNLHVINRNHRPGRTTNIPNTHGIHKTKHLASWYMFSIESKLHTQHHTCDSGSPLARDYERSLEPSHKSSHLLHSRSSFVL